MEKTHSHNSARTVAQPNANGQRKYARYANIQADSLLFWVRFANAEMRTVCSCDRWWPNKGYIFCIHSTVRTLGVSIMADLNFWSIDEKCTRSASHRCHRKSSQRNMADKRPPTRKSISSRSRSFSSHLHRANVVGPKLSYHLIWAGWIFGWHGVRTQRLNSRQPFVAGPFDVTTEQLFWGEQREMHLPRFITGRNVQLNATAANEFRLFCYFADAPSCCMQTEALILMHNVAFYGSRCILFACCVRLKQYLMVRMCYNSGGRRTCVVSGADRKCCEIAKHRFEDKV